MLIRNNGTAPVTMNLRDGTSYLLQPGVATSVPDAATTMIDDSPVLIALFNAGTLTVTTDAGGAFPGFPTVVNSTDSAVGKLLTVRAKVGTGGVRTLVDETGQPVGGGGGVAGYQLNLTLPSGADNIAAALPRFIKAARLARGGTHTIIAVARNSTGVGYAPGEGGNVGARAWSPVSVMTRALQKLGVTVNTQNFMGEQNVQTNANTAAQYDPRIVLGAGWSAVQLKGPGGGAFQNSTTTAPLSFRCDAPVDTAIFFYTTNNNPGDITVDVGGATLTTMVGNQNGGFRSTGPIALGSLALHTINIKNPTGAGQNYFNGMVAWSSVDPGISIVNIGWNGMTGVQLVDGSFAWSIFNSFPALGAAGVSLYITGEGINDGLSGTPAATRTANMASVITKMKAGGFSDVILMSDPASLPNRISQATQDAYEAGYQSLINSAGVPYLSSPAYLGGNDSAAGALVYADDFGHLTRYGYSLLGLLPASVLLNAGV